MKNTKLWIADPDLAYVQAFAEYVNLKKGYLFQVCACTDQTRMEQTPDGDETEILLITAKWYEAWKDVLQGKCVILLSEGNLPGKFTSYPTVYKYQSVKRFCGRSCIIIRSRTTGSCIRREYERITG